MANHATDNLAEQVTVSMRAPGRPEDFVSVTITAAETFSTTDPADVAILMFWRCVEGAGQRATAESVWHHMVSQGMRQDGGQPIQQETVEDAVARLMDRGLISQGGESL